MKNLNNIIEINNLTKQYGSQIAVNNLSITVESGQIYGFLGRNGAGKTITIRMLLGLIKPTKGNIKIFEKEFESNKTEILKNIGAMVETPGFYSNLTAKENLTINAKILGIQKENAIEEVLEIVGLASEKVKLFKNYSLGMKQRLGIARALLHNPELLILDEPTNGLDPIGIKEIRKLIKDLAQSRNITILISSHILSEIEQLVDKVGIIHNGVLLEEIMYEDLKKKNRQFISISVSDEEKVACLLETNFGIYDYKIKENGEFKIYSHIDRQQEINRLLVLNNIDVFQMRVIEDNLETYFEDLVGGGTIG
ncbi:TPA: ABC transporter ATP-binding protein [Staphylococcus aureus]